MKVLNRKIADELAYRIHPKLEYFATLLAEGPEDSVYHDYVIGHMGYFDISVLIYLDRISIGNETFPFSDPECVQKATAFLKERGFFVL